MKTQINNLNISDYKNLIDVKTLRETIPQTERSIDTIIKGRQDFMKVLTGKDNRFVVVVGPCSIHDLNVAREYADKLIDLKKKVSDKLLIFMRVYFEKPRTTIGWKGFINDPHLDNSNDLEEGLKLSRKLLVELSEKGVYAATELLDPIIAAYIGELVPWVAIGARTTESQTHRQMASGLSAPVGYKNGTDGNVDIAINAIQSGANPHSFLSIDDDGRVSVVTTTGNPYGHIILRGGGGRPNFHLEDIATVEEKLLKKNFLPKIMVDCSHANSNKDYTKQNLVVKDVLGQKTMGNQSIFGIMLESHLKPGKQDLTDDLDSLQYGVSITDGCIGWDETEELIRSFHHRL